MTHQTKNTKRRSPVDSNNRSNPKLKTKMSLSQCSADSVKNNIPNPKLKTRILLWQCSVDSITNNRSNQKLKTTIWLWQCSVDSVKNNRSKRTTDETKQSKRRFGYDNAPLIQFWVESFLQHWRLEGLCGSTVVWKLWSITADLTAARRFGVVFLVQNEHSTFRTINRLVRASRLRQDTCRCLQPVPSSVTTEIKLKKKKKKEKRRRRWWWWWWCGASCPRMSSGWHIRDKL